MAFSSQALTMHLRHVTSLFPPTTRCLSSHMRVSMPDGLSANELKYALRDYGSTVLLEVERPAKSFCGWEPPHDDVHQAHLFGAQLSALFSAHSVPAATSTSGHGAGLPRCTHYHGGVGTVLNFENLGVAEKHNVGAHCPPPLSTGPMMLLALALPAVALSAVMTEGAKSLFPITPCRGAGLTAARERPPSTAARKPVPKSCSCWGARSFQPCGDCCS